MIKINFKAIFKHIIGAIIFFLVIKFGNAYLNHQKEIKRHQYQKIPKYEIKYMRK